MRAYTIDGIKIELGYINTYDWYNDNTGKTGTKGTLVYKKNDGEIYVFSHNVEVKPIEEFFNNKSNAKKFVKRRNKLICWVD